MFKVVLFLSLLIIGLSISALGAEMSTSISTNSASLPAKEEPYKISDDIEDNSFLIEEAFNQEKGVEQHIQSFQFMRDGSYLYTFTEESPVGGRNHQLSVTVPYLQTPNVSGNQSGLGDIAINYRYQLIDGEEFLLAPRFSILTPSGDFKKGTGNGAVGYQGMLPASFKLNRYFISHFNLGGTYTPGRRANENLTYDSFAFNYGASLIWLAHHKLNVMLEVVGLTDRVADENGSGTKSQTTLYINPGVRYAINFDSGLQIVPGVSFPIGASSAAGSNGVLTYLSFEHPMF